MSLSVSWSFIFMMLQADVFSFAPQPLAVVCAFVYKDWNYADSCLLMMRCSGFYLFILQLLLVHAEYAGCGAFLN